MNVQPSLRPDPSPNRRKSAESLPAAATKQKHRPPRQYPAGAGRGWAHASLSADASIAALGLRIGMSLIIGKHRPVSLEK